MQQPSKRELPTFNDATSISKRSVSSGAISVRKTTKMNPIYGYEFYSVRALAKDTVILRVPKQIYNTFISYENKAFDQWDVKETETHFPAEILLPSATKKIK
jgi:hypothetical protein